MSLEAITSTHSVLQKSPHPLFLKPIKNEKIYPIYMEYFPDVGDFCVKHANIMNIGNI